MRISDWSSDVCSSDLRELDPSEHVSLAHAHGARRFDDVASDLADAGVGVHEDRREGEQEIGRASGRERVGQYVEILVVVVSFTKKQYNTSDILRKYTIC